MDSIVSLRLDLAAGTFFVPTFENTSLQITRSVQSLETISSAQKTVTEQTFRVPLSGELIEAVGDLADPGVTANVDLRKNIEGAILVNGFPVYLGSFNVISVTVNPKSNAREVELIFKGNESSLKSQLELIKLSELLDGETIPYDVDEIADYYADQSSYATTNGYAWDIIDYGQDFYGINGTGGKRIDDSANPLSQIDFKPSLVVQRVFDLIETELGITWTNDSSIDDLFTQRIPLHNNESIFPVLDTSRKDNTGYMDRTVNISYTRNNDGTSAVAVLNFNQAVNFNQTVFEVTQDKYTAQRDGSHDFTLFADFNFSHNAATFVSMTMRFSIYINGVFDKYIGVVNSSTLVGATDRIQNTFTFVQQLTTGDEVKIEYDLSSVSTTGTYTATFQQLTTTQWTCIEVPLLAATSNVLPALNIDKDLTAWDVVNAIISQCNGIVTRDGSNYDITPWTTWIDDNADVININDRIDESRDISIEPTSVTGAKSIRFTYEEGEDFYNQKYKELQGEQYGELFIADTGSDFATETYEIKIPFAAGVPVPMDGANLTIIKMIDSDGNLIKNTPMLLSLSDSTAWQSIILQDYFGGTVYTRSGIQSLNHWINTANPGFTSDDNHFGTSLTFFAASGYPNNTLYERFWRRYVREVYGQNSRKLELSIKATPTEFSTWLLNEKLLYNGQYFRFNSIDNFNLNKREPVKIEMVKRIELQNSEIAPYYPVDVLNGVVQWFDSSDNSDVGDGSAEPAADIEASCLAYGFFYDSTNNIGIQIGQILPIS